MDGFERVYGSYDWDQQNQKSERILEYIHHDNGKLILFESECNDMIVDYILVKKQTLTLVVKVIS